MDAINNSTAQRVPWNKGKLVGQKAPLKQREIWAIRIRLQLQEDVRELALFNLAIDSKLRSCDLVRLHVRDVCQGGRISSRAIVMQRKTQRPVQFEITEQTRESISTWIGEARLKPDDCLFSSRLRSSPHVSTRQYARIVRRWVQGIGLKSGGLRNAHHAADQGGADLSENQEPARRATPARAQQAPEYGPVPRHRCR